MKKKVYLTLQNGKTLQGYAFGARGEVVGELVFSTSAVGYIETLTDPANYGKIVVQTFPLIGNYGMMYADRESDRAWVSAYVVREICDAPSNFRTETTLESYLKEQGVVGIYGVDTRELTKILRDEGEMNAKISEKPLTDEEIASLAGVKTKNAVQTVVGNKKGYFAAENEKRKVVLWDFGARNSTAANLNAQGYSVVSLPAQTTAEEILSLDIDGVVVSDGPGDPAENAAAIEEIKKVLAQKPVLGIGLGHLLVALAFGNEVVARKCGHRGGNQPVKCCKCGKVFISTQNHRYDVVKEKIKAGEISFVNVNDGSCEGMEYDNAITVQFLPEACDIGVEENPVYKKFLALMEEKENA